MLPLLLLIKGWDYTRTRAVTVRRKSAGWMMSELLQFGVAELWRHLRGIVQGASLEGASTANVIRKDTELTNWKNSSALSDGTRWLRNKLLIDIAKGQFHRPWRGIFSI